MLSKFPQKINSGVTVTLTCDEVYVEFIKPLPLREIQSFINKYQLEILGELGFFIGAQSEELYLSSDWLWLRNRKGELTDEFMEELYADEQVKVVNPVYHRPDMFSKSGFSFSAQLMVKLQPKVPVEEFKALIKRLKDVEDVTPEPNLLGDDVRLLQIKVPQQRHALDLADEIAELKIVESTEPDWIQLNSSINSPDDTYYLGKDENNQDLIEWDATKGYQWNLHKIKFQEAWDWADDNITVKRKNVVIAIMDKGFDLEHDDLKKKYVDKKNWLNVPMYFHLHKTLLKDTTTPPKLNDPLINYPQDYEGHGTCCAGIAAAETNNGKGIAGVGWPCQIMPIQTHGWFITKINGKRWLLYEVNHVKNIRVAFYWAAIKNKVDVISMSWNYFGPYTPEEKSLLDLSLDQALKKKIVLVAAANCYFCQNECLKIYQIKTPVLAENIGGYFQTKKEVIVVGASDMEDKRHRYDLNEKLVLDASPDEERWCSCYGITLDVMAPGVKLWTTDIRDEPELNQAFKLWYVYWYTINFGPKDFSNITGAGGNCTKGNRHWEPVSCKQYTNCGDKEGNYISLMRGTSGATPHVAGLAGLLLALFPNLKPDDIHSIICETADKVGGYNYVNDSVHPHGKWHEEMGYGRINMKQALVEAKKKQNPNP